MTILSLWAKIFTYGAFGSAKTIKLIVWISEYIIFGTVQGKSEDSLIIVPQHRWIRTGHCFQARCVCILTFLTYWHWVCINLWNFFVWCNPAASRSPAKCTLTRKWVILFSSLRVIEVNVSANGINNKTRHIIHWWCESYLQLSRRVKWYSCNGAHTSNFSFKWYGSLFRLTLCICGLNINEFVSCHIRHILEFLPYIENRRDQGKYWVRTVFLQSKIQFLTFKTLTKSLSNGK